jgi:hypothetical protein
MHLVSLFQSAGNNVLCIEQAPYLLLLGRTNLGRIGACLHLATTTMSSTPRNFVEITGSICGWACTIFLRFAQMPWA